MTLPLELGAIQDDLARRALEQIAQQFPIGANQLASGQAGTTFPNPAINGQEYYYVADSTNGVVWHFKYRTTSGKWECVGGPPLFAEVTTGETTASATYVALTTAGPSIAIPLAGDYDVEIGARIASDSANQGGRMSYDIGGTGAVDADNVFNIMGTGVSGGSLARVRRKTGLTAVTLTAKYRTTGLGICTFESRWMRVTPVRLA